MESFPILQEIEIVEQLSLQILLPIATRSVDLLGQLFHLADILQGSLE